MSLKNVWLLAGGLMLGAGSLSAQATTSEPTLKSILKAEYNGIWKQVSFASLSSASWNVAGTTLTFSLISENADFAGINSFGIKDGASTVNVFAGSATPASPDVSYVLQNSLSSIFFKTGGVQIDQYKIFVNSKGEYAFAYEDTVGKTSDKDYNDMVVTLKYTTVVPVPEAETISMMMAGLGLMGVVTRRKKKTTA